jgi:hypothetical protein
VAGLDWRGGEERCLRAPLPVDIQTAASSCQSELWCECLCLTKLSAQPSIKRACMSQQSKQAESHTFLHSRYSSTLHFFSTGKKKPIASLLLMLFVKKYNQDYVNQDKVMPYHSICPIVHLSISSSPPNPISRLLYILFFLLLFPSTLPSSSRSPP